MSTSPLRGGSRVSARGRSPSVNLFKLAELLAQCITTPTAGTGSESLPLATFSGNKLSLHTQVVLRRLINLLKHLEFESAFALGDASGFLQDAVIPPFGTTAKMGGRLVQGSEAATSKAINALRHAVSDELDKALQGGDLAVLILPSLDAAMKAMASTIKTEPAELPESATIVPVEFADPSRKAAERERDIGRVLSGIETIDGRDWLELFLAGIERKLQNDGDDPDEIDEILTAIRTQCGHPGSQMRRFLEFLEDEAMARVRLQVCMRLMDAVAAQSSKPGFRGYVRRVRECFDAFADAGGNALSLDLSKDFGVANDVEFGQELRKASFYGCLPVWSEASVQLFERRIDPTQNQPTVREVSYRFRVNGINPNSGKSAFDTRLDRIHESLLDASAENNRIKRQVAELVFLTLVVPAGLDKEVTSAVKDDAEAIAQELRRAPAATVSKLLDKLYSRSKVVDELAGELIRTLRTKSKALMTLTNRGGERLLVSVHRDIVDWAVVKGMSSAKEDILVKPETASENIAWFEHLRVSKSPWPGSIASIAVDTQLQERTLASTGQAKRINMSKHLSAPVLPVRLIPYMRSKTEDSWLPAVPTLEILDAGCGVEIEYDLRLLTLTRKKDAEKGKAEQFRSALLSAPAVLLYVTLWTIAQRVKARIPELTMTLIRLQKAGRVEDREADAHDGNTAIYAISHALEKALRNVCTTHP